MSASRTMTIFQAIAEMRKKVARGLPVGKSGSEYELQRSFGSLADKPEAVEGHGERFEYRRQVPNQSVAFPELQTPLRLYLTVMALNDGRLVLRLDATWGSIYGVHISTVKWLVSSTGSRVNISSRLNTIPTPTLENIDVHTGGVSADEYHRRTLTTALPNSPLSGLLRSCVSTDEVDPKDLVGIAEVVVNSTPLL